MASELEVFTLDGHSEGVIPLPGLGTVHGLSGRWDSDELFFDFESYTTPPSTLRASVSSRTVSSFWKSAVPFDTGRFDMQQVWVASKDGTKVPMFVIHRRGLALDGNTPTLLYGYGGFAVSILPDFSPAAAWWIEQGGVYAVANIRGGSEFGEAWHRAGMLANKQNVFDDFIASASWLIEHRYTSPQKLAIQGASNGGLLMGAVLTQRPDLFRAVLCEFPDLDMIGYWRFPNNNPPALLEYGDASKPDQFKFLLAYSPYQKIAHPVLLLYDTKAGHAGGRPLGKVIDDESLELAFLAWQLGI